MTMNPKVCQITHKNIWNLSQNRPILIVRDIFRLMENKNTSLWNSSDIYEILLARGVFKWFSVRRDLIKLKDKMKNSITTSIAAQHIYKRDRSVRRYNMIAYEQGYRAATEHWRAEIRRMCHSQRWRAPDNDKHAQRWLDKRTEDENKREGHTPSSSLSGSREQAV